MKECRDNALFIKTMSRSEGDRIDPAKITVVTLRDKSLDRIDDRRVGIGRFPQNPEEILCVAHLTISGLEYGRGSCSARGSQAQDRYISFGCYNAAPLRATLGKRSAHHSG
jgi:hypothetical protein